MKFNKSLVLISALGVLSLFAGCGGSSPSSSGGCPAANTSCTTATTGTLIPTSTTSQVQIDVADQSTTGSYGYANEPLVSVTICTPGHTSNSQCQTVSNILLDTGSYGLRIFGSAINSNVQLQQQTVNVLGETMNLAEYAEFGSGSDWGSVETADITLGNQSATNIPIQVININFAQIPSELADQCPDTDPCTALYNGILGVGLFAQDCGSDCDSTDDHTNPGIYFGCDNTGCYDAYQGSCNDQTCVIQVPTSQQVINPISSFGLNGVSLTLPSVGANGASGVTGTLTLGIGSVSGPTVFSADSTGMSTSDGRGADFTTIFQGTTYGGLGNVPDPNTGANNAAFIDSGSNGIFFPSGIATCSDSSDFYCGGGQSLSATMYDFNGDANPNETVSFTVGDADNLFNTGNSCFNNIAGPTTLGFDWGFPFFLGKTVYVGLSGASATFNSSPITGPYWAF
jgi:hypothetical protein